MGRVPRTSWAAGRQAPVHASPGARCPGAVQGPAALPSLLAGVRIALTLSFVLVIGAELVASRVGLGNLILGFGENGVFDYMFATFLAVLIVAVAVDRAYLGLMARALRWHEPPA